MLYLTNQTNQSAHKDYFSNPKGVTWEAVLNVQDRATLIVAPHGALRRFKQQKIPQRWKVAFLEGIDEYIHPPKFQKLAIGGF